MCFQWHVVPEGFGINMFLLFFACTNCTTGNLQLKVVECLFFFGIDSRMTATKLATSGIKLHVSQTIKLSSNNCPLITWKYIWLGYDQTQKQFDILEKRWGSRAFCDYACLSLDIDCQLASTLLRPADCIQERITHKERSTSHFTLEEVGWFSDMSLLQDCLSIPHLS